MNAFAEENYPQAIENFKASLKKNPDDPEAQIFLHNARIGHQTGHTLAVNIFASANAMPDLPQLRGTARMLPGAEDMTDAAVKIAIVRADDVDVTKQAAHDLVKQPNVIGVVGPTFRLAELAIDDIYCSHEIVNIASISRSLGRQKTNCSGYAFHLAPNERVEAQAMARYILNKTRYRKVAVFFLSSHLRSQSTKSEFKNTFMNNGGQIANEFDVESKTFSPSKSIQRVLKDQAELIVIFPSSEMLRERSGKPNSLLEILQSNHQFLPVLTGASAFDHKLLKMVKTIGGEGKGIMVTAPCCSKTSPDGRWRDIFTQDAIEIFMAALKKNSTKHGIHQVLSDPNFKIQGESGQIRFSADGDRITKPEFVQVLPGSQSGFGYDFVPLR